MREVVFLRAALASAPFALWFLWRAWARRTGRDPAAAPWFWLIAAAGVLVGLSLLVTGLGRPDTRGLTYVPAEVGPGGRVGPSRYEASAR